MVVGNLVSFGSAEDEDNPFRRLFQSLQQSVESFFGNLVRFVDDEYFVVIARRTIADVFADLAHFIDAAIGSGVDFDDVDRVSGAISVQLEQTPQGLAVGP